MTVALVEPFMELSRSDASVASLARLTAVALREAEGSEWLAAPPELSRERMSLGIPLLHGASLAVDPERPLTLLRSLAQEAQRAGIAESAALQGALGSRWNAAQLDPLALLGASIRMDGEALEEIAARAGVDGGLLATLVHLASIPLLWAVAHGARTVLEGAPWSAGHCPLCAAWPTLAELRGLERRRWLRCGRCSSAWELAGQQCYVCENRDHRQMGYLAAESERESRMAVTCDSCQSYLKGFATVAPLRREQVLLRDLDSVELDLAAIEGYYGRPEGPGFPLEVELEAVQKRGWLPW